MKRREKKRASREENAFEQVALLGYTTADEIKHALQDHPGAMWSVKTGEIRIRIGDATFRAKGADVAKGKDAELSMYPPKLAPTLALYLLSRMLQLPAAKRRRGGKWWLFLPLDFPISQFNYKRPERWVPQILSLTDAEHAPRMYIRGTVGKQPNAPRIEVDLIRGCIWGHGSWKDARSTLDFINLMRSGLGTLREFVS